MKKGLDLSQHNGIIDFTKVKESGIEFVILRVGWIGNKENHTIDTKFEEYYKKAKSVGLKIGYYVYNYCKSSNTVISGANWCLQQLRNKQIDYPIFIDMEDKAINGLSKNELTEQCIQFCNFFKVKGYKSGIYANKSWFNTKLDINKLLEYKIWLAEWNGKENHTADFKVDLWQYSSKGKVNGINGNVDMNYCLCNEENQETQTGQVKNYEVGKTYILQVDLKVRAGAGTNYRQKKYSELTADGKKNAYNQTLAVLKKGTKITCKEVINNGSDIWLKIPSGYIAGYYQNKVYVN